MIRMICGMRMFCVMVMRMRIGGRLGIRRVMMVAVMAVLRVHG
jgi:hypothetical protein